MNLDFFRHTPAPVGETGGGMANAIVGSLIVTGLGALFAIPVGVLSGLYAAEYRGTRFASATRFAADTLNGVPSIVIGVFAYGVAVLPFKHFSALAGGFALGIMMIPLIMRTTEELLLLVPSSLREGALALGATRARAVFTVVLPAALPGIVTGILLALSRIAGETAPLLFTSLNNGFWSTDVSHPIATLTVQVFAYAIAPYEDWHRQAWAGALVLVTIVLLCSGTRAVGDCTNGAAAQGRLILVGYWPTASGYWLLAEPDRKPILVFRFLPFDSPVSQQAAASSQQPAARVLTDYVTPS